MHSSRDEGMVFFGGFIENLIPLNHPSTDSNYISWVKTSALQDTIVTQYKDKSFSVLKVKNSGISKFALDPSLRSVCWDYGDVKDRCQQLFAQDIDGNVFLYDVEEKCVVEALRIPASKLASVVSKSFHYGDQVLELVGCNSGHIVFCIESMSLICLHVNQSGTLHLRCTLPLPEALFTTESKSSPSLSDGTEASMLSHSLMSVYQIVNGFIVIYDLAVSMMFMHALVTGHCICQLDLQPLGVQADTLLSWRISQDLNVLMVVFSNGCVKRVNVSRFALMFPSSVKLIDDKGKEQTFSEEYFTLSVCHYRDLALKQEITDTHSSSPNPRSKQSSSKKKNKSSSGAKGTQGKQILKENIPTKASPALEYQTSLSLEESLQDGWSILNMETVDSTLSLAMARTDLKPGLMGRKALALVRFQDKTVNLHQLNDETTVVLSGMPLCSHLLWSQKYLMFLSPHVSLLRDDLVSWVMSHSGPRVSGQSEEPAESGGNALESSLQQKELGTLKFLFEAKQDLFSAAVQHKREYSLVSKVHQLEDPLDLVTKTALEYVSDSQSRSFAQRMLSLTFDFVYGLLDDAKGVWERREKAADSKDPSIVEEQIKESCEILLRHIPDLRKCMASLQLQSGQIQGNSVSEMNSSKMRSAISLRTEAEVNMKQIIKEDMLSSLRFLLLSEDQNRLMHYRQLVAELLDTIKTHLENRDISACQHILNNLGCDVTSTLWSLAQFYASRPLQQFIISQLSAAAALTQGQRQLIQFLEQLYASYPLDTFHESEKQKIHDVTRTWPDKDDPTKRVIIKHDISLHSHCGELYETNVSSEGSATDSSLYVSVLLAWLSQWTEEMRQGVMLDAHFLKSEDSVSALNSDSASTWAFLMSHNLLSTIKSVLESAGENSDLYLLGNLPHFLHFGWSHLRREVAVELLRLGKLSMDVAVSQNMDVHALLPILGGPLNKKHLLSYLGAMGLSQFHSEFVSRCVASGLQLPLWMYCTAHGIKPSELRLSETCAWFPLFQAAYSIPRHPTDKTLMLSASLMAAADLWAISGPLNVEMMLAKGQILTAVATLSYMSEENVNLDPNTVEKYLQKCPKMMAALMPEGHESSSKDNASVYHLLMGNVPFDLRRLFGWNPTNIFAGEDSPKVMPHFSESELTKTHSKPLKLSFPYYLKHGRPVYAFLSFLVEELDRIEATISLKRMEQACGAALWIACQNFDTPHISSACVVFVELLGRDSVLVRSMINTGRVLLTHKHRQILGGTEMRKEQLKECVDKIVSDLLACVRSSQQHAGTLIVSLESAIKEEILLEGIGSFEASQKWILVVILCQLLSVPLTTCFLQSCAESDNWLMFTWFAQLHQYPTIQLQGLLHSFRSPHLRDHLHYVLKNADNKLFSVPSLASSTSSSGHSAFIEHQLSHPQRSTQFNRGGGQAAKGDSSSEEEAPKGGIVLSSFSSRLKQAALHEYDMPESAVPDDVFRMLFHSQSLASQWRCLLSAAVSLRNPLFAELAACCGCPALPSLCGWLVASLSPATKQQFLDDHGHLVSKWTLNNLEALISVILIDGQEDALVTAFTILQHQSPVLPFLCFITECVKRGSYAACKSHIDQFKDEMSAFDSSLASNKSSADIETIGDKVWFEKVVYQILIHELKFMKSLYHAWHYLQILDKHNLCLIFSFDVLNFALLHKVVNILHSNGVPGLDLPLLLTSGTMSKPFAGQCRTAVDFLISSRIFSDAHDLAEMTGIGRDRVTISQLKEERERLVISGVWTAKNVRIRFWNKCKMQMFETHTGHDTCSEFFKGELLGTLAENEKALLCQYWFSLLERSSDPLIMAERDNVLRDMWRHRIAAKMAVEEMDPLDSVFEEVHSSEKSMGDMKADLIQASSKLQSHNVSDVHQDLTAQELDVLDSLIGSYLDDGHVSACVQVAAVFGHYNKDLAIIQTCNSLASGRESPDSIEPAMKRLLSKPTALKIRSHSFTKSYSVSSLNLLTSSLEETEVNQNDRLEVTYVLEKLLANCVRGHQVCLYITTCYKIAQILKSDFKNILVASEFDSLRQLLRSNHLQKFALARDFLATSGLSDHEVTGFLADSIVDVLQVFLKGHADSDLYVEESSVASKLVFNPSDGMEVFSQFLVLCENTSLLGDRILEAVASQVSVNENLSATVLTIQTELIILAHECYTMSSNMEGISHVLRAARVCCDCLTEAREFTLMIRLLTGVGRYSEMMYVFHALQNHHQFELLLRKGMDKEDKLKVAILDYLKRFQPDDKEAYTMVALKFSMFRDIAGMLESCGHSTLKDLKGRSLDNSRDIQLLLKKGMQYFQDAAESYVKDNSVRAAQKCIKMARLLSLQLQLLPNGIIVIHQNRDQVTAFVNTHSRFIEAMIVSNAYESRSDWTEAVYQNVVINGDNSYFQEMKLHIPITSSLVEDVVKRYKQAPSYSSSTLNAIRKLLIECRDAKLQYRLASELGLTDIVTSMLKGDTGHYLQDVTGL